MPRGVLIGLAILFVGIALVSCEGPVGVPGVDAGGVDIIPPTVVVTRPVPLTQQWDSLLIVVKAVDNVAVTRVTATVNGSVYTGGRYLVTTVPPYTFGLDSTGLSVGWNYISAQAFDPAGNSSNAPTIPIWFGSSSVLRDTTTLVYTHNQRADTSWTIPNANRIRGYWSSFKPAKDCLLDTIRVQLSGHFADTTEALVTVTLWQGVSYPEQIVAQGEKTIPAITLSASARWEWVEFNRISIKRRYNYYLVIGLKESLNGDTLRVWSDNGSPPYGNSGAFDDVGWHTLGDQFGAPNNFLVSSQLYYEP